MARIEFLTPPPPEKSAGPLSAEEAKRSARFDREKVEAMTEKDIERHAVEDGNVLQPGSRRRRPDRKDR